MTTLYHIFEGFTLASVAVDAEWDFKQTQTHQLTRRRPRKMLTKQYSMISTEGQHLNLVLWDKNYPLPSVIPSDVTVYPCDVEVTNLSWFLKNTPLTLALGGVEVLMFYAPADLECIINKADFNRYLSEDRIIQKRNLSGNIYLDPDTFEVDHTPRKRPHKTSLYFKIKDCFGMFNSGLDKAFDSVGVVNPHKNAYTKEQKGRMAEMIKSDPNTFLNYALGDTVFMHEIVAKRTIQINKIIRDALDIDMGFTPDNIPRSSGKLTETVFRRWLAKEYGEVLWAAEMMADTRSKRDLALKKRYYQSRLDPISKTVSIPFSKMLPRQLWDLGGMWQNDSIAGTAHGSIPALGSRQPRFGIPLLALVNGGRCINENPLRMVLQDVFDIDMASCYGSSLAQFIYPLGIPTILTGVVKEGEGCKSLADMAKHFAEMEMWQAVCHTDEPLSFQQDLIFSNPDTNPQKIYRTILGEKYEDDDEIESPLERTHINGGFCLINREIKNGILTAESYNILKKVSTRSEWKELSQKLKIDVLAGYKSSDKVSPSEYVKIVTNPHLRGAFECKDGDEIDNRTRAWVGLPLSGFIKPLLAVRKSYKKQKLVKGDQFDLLQDTCKLFINTLYGVMASPYFHTSNAILANNITDRARVGVWMVSKALGTNMSITDGGAYQNGDPRVIKRDGKNALPGLNDMADYNRLNRHRLVKNKPLVDSFDSLYNLCKSPQDSPLIDQVWLDLSNQGCGVSSEQFLEGVNKDGATYIHSLLDGLALTRINNFWENYDGLELPFGLEHKVGHTALKMAHFNKSDYLFIDPISPDKDLSPLVSSRPYVVKVRGAREVDHPKKCLLGLLAGEVDSCPTHLISEGFLKTNEVKAELSRTGLDSGVEVGMAEERVESLKINFNHIPFDTVEARKYHLSRIEKVVGELKEAEQPYRELWAMLGDPSVLAEMPRHPLFDLAQNSDLTLIDYITKVLMVQGTDKVYQAKVVRKSGASPELLKVRYTELYGRGMKKLEAYRILAEEFKLGQATVRRWLSKV